MQSVFRIVSRSSKIAGAIVVAGAISVAGDAQAQVSARVAAGDVAKGKGHYADVNGIKLYYEIQGSGKPLILLHGGLGAIEMFGPNLAALAKGRQVIGVD